LTKKKKDFSLVILSSEEEISQLKNEEKRHIALHVIPKNICHLLGAQGEREKKLMKYKLTLESILMTSAFFPVGSTVLFTLSFMLLLRLTGTRSQPGSC